MINDNGDSSYIDAKGRTRWRRNDEVADLLKQLGDVLIIGGYEASHAARYPKLAYVISRHPESVVRMHEDGRLNEIPGVGPTVMTIIGQLIETGTCAKMNESGDGYAPPPSGVLELAAVPGVGAKTVRTLYREHGIDGVAALRDALDGGRLNGVPGLGKKTLGALRGYLVARDAG